MRSLTLVLCLGVSPIAHAQDTPEAPTRDTAEASPPAEASMAAESVASTPAPDPEATPETRARTSVDTTGAHSAGTATRVDALRVDPSTIVPPTDDATQAAYDDAVAALTTGIDTARRGLVEAERAEATARTEVKVAKTNITTRKLEYKAASSELKVQRMGAGGEAAAVRAAEDAKRAMKQATAMLMIKQAEARHAGAHADHLDALIDRLQTTLVEVTLRGGADPVQDAAALLSAQKDTSEAIGAEAKARDALAKALHAVEKAKDKLAKVK